MTKLTGVSRVFIRGKRTSRGGLDAATQKAITQLSVMSASRKQPRLLKLSKEDFIKHQIIQESWVQHQRELRAQRAQKLQLQHASCSHAMEVLRQTNPSLYKAAAAPETVQRFPLELRTPTEYPPTTIWASKFKKPE